VPLYVHRQRNQFWEYTEYGNGTALLFRAGALGTEGERSDLDFDTAEQARGELARLTSLRLKRGYELMDEADALKLSEAEAPKVDLQALSLDGWEALINGPAAGAPEGPADSEALERAILDDPDDAAGWLVYGDHLQARGDIRGRLTAVYARDPGQAAAFVEEHAEELYLHLADELSEPSWAQSIRWRYGFIEHVTLLRYFDADAPDDHLALNASQLLELPAARLLGSLALEDYDEEFGDDGTDPEDAAALEADRDDAWSNVIRCVAERCGGSLRTLQFGPWTLGPETERTLIECAPRFTRLERLEVPGGSPSPGLAAAFPRL
jgi:uncharacterized protein (TIGR02996 family)